MRKTNRSINEKLFKTQVRDGRGKLKGWGTKNPIEVALRLKFLMSQIVHKYCSIFVCFENQYKKA